MVPRSFWPHVPEVWWLVTGVMIGAGAVLAALRYYAPRALTGPLVLDDYRLRLIDWERDRVESAAKGLAGTAVGFLGAVVTALVKNEIALRVSVLSILGCLLGAVGVVLLAMHWSLAAMRFVRAPVAAPGSKP